MATDHNTVYLLVGTRAAGKSAFCEKLVSGRPDLAVVSRDEILIRLFGKTSLSPYGGGHFHALEVMNEELREKLSARNGQSLILDAWIGESEERKELIKALRKYGATRVIALYFVTPVEYVKKWFWQKPGIAPVSQMREKDGQGYSFYGDDAPERDNELFHELAKDIDSDGFDRVVRVNPLIDPPDLDAIIAAAPRKKRRKAKIK